MQQQFPDAKNVPTMEKLVKYRVLRCQRDWNHGVGTTDSIFVTSEAQRLVQKIWSLYKDGRSPIFVAGAPGTGKSCAATLLAALVANWEPDTHVYHLREYMRPAYETIQNEVTERCLEGRKSFVIVDQLKTNAAANEVYSSLGKLCLVMVASANIPLFYETRMGANSNPARHYYAYAASPLDCHTISNCTLRNAPKVPDTFYEMLALSRPDSASGRRNFYRQILKWSNFHLLTVRKLMVNRESVESVMDRYRNALDGSVSETNGRMFYLLIYNMFKAGKVVADSFQLDNEDQDGDYELDAVVRKKVKPTAATTMTSTVSKVAPSRTATTARSRKSTTPTTTSETQVTPPPPRFSSELFSYLDFRFVDEHGRVLSPAILQALELWLTLSDPPEQLLQKQCESELNRANPSAKGFIIERLCLKENKLQALANRCCHTLNLNKNLTKSKIQRIPFRRLDDVLAKIRRLDSQDSATFHFIPLQWNFRRIDALQIYTHQKQTLIIGNQITVQTANGHSKSLEWIDEARHIAKFLPNPIIVLAFVAISEKSATRTVSVPPSIAKKWAASNTHVVHYPVEHMVDTAIAKSMGWIDEDAGIDGPKKRLVTLVTKATRKRKPKKK